MADTFNAGGRVLAVEPVGGANAVRTAGEGLVAVVGLDRVHRGVRAHHPLQLNQNILYCIIDNVYGRGIELSYSRWISFISRYETDYVSCLDISIRYVHMHSNLL